MLTGLHDIIYYSTIHFTTSSKIKKTTSGWLNDKRVCLSCGRSRFAPWLGVTIIKWYKLVPCLARMSKGRNLTV